MGVLAVSTDVWWGLVEKDKDSYDWTYYDKLFQYITDAGLKIHPIMSMLTLAINAFDEQFDEVPIGIKIPGVHWTAGGYDQANNFANKMPRSAEVCAGIISSNFTPDIAANGCGPGYTSSIQMIANLESSTSADVDLYFTCIDMANNDVAPAYSMASVLVFGVGTQAHAKGLTLKGENALAPNSGSNWNKNNFWWNINNVISCSWYDGVNVLRIFNVVDSTQKTNYQKLINEHADN